MSARFCPSSPGPFPREERGGKSGSLFHRNNGGRGALVSSSGLFCSNQMQQEVARSNQECDEDGVGYWGIQGVQPEERKHGNDGGRGVG